jgi:hypothetical protein
MFIIYTDTNHNYINFVESMLDIVKTPRCARSKVIGRVVVVSTKTTIYIEI